MLCTILIEAFDKHLAEIYFSQSNLDCNGEILLVLLPLGLENHADHASKLFPLFVFEVDPRPVQHCNFLKNFHLLRNSLVYCRLLGKLVRFIDLFNLGLWASLLWVQQLFVIVLVLKAHGLWLLVLILFWDGSICLTIVVSCTPDLILVVGASNYEEKGKQGPNLVEMLR